MPQLRIYVDTSVIGGCLDEEFEVPSTELMEMARRGEVRLVVSDLLLQELTLAPLAVQEVLSSIPSNAIEGVVSDQESRDLRDAYLATGLFGPASAMDAHHVAVATIARADLIVSWNFRHIVHVDKIKAFNAVNLLRNYGTIDIRSPLEIV